jgi:hypothetical protein
LIRPASALWHACHAKLYQNLGGLHPKPRDQNLLVSRFLQVSQQAAEPFSKMQAGKAKTAERWRKKSWVLRVSIKTSQIPST